jgi:hypothetical protein
LASLSDVRLVHPWVLGGVARHIGVSSMVSPVRLICDIPVGNNYSSRLRDIQVAATLGIN